MNTNRRHFLALGLPLAAVTLAGRDAPGAAQSRPVSAPPAPQRFAKPSEMKLGLVTFNLGRTWDIKDIIANCRAAKFEGVELRATHAHKVEVGLSKEQRTAVRKQFDDAGLDLMGLGSAFDFHTPDAARLRKTMDAAKEYIELAHDVGAAGIKVRPNDLPKEVPEEKTLEQIGRSLDELGRFAEGFGIQIRLEVHGKGTSFLPNIRKIMDHAPNKMAGVCWNCNQTDLFGDGFDANFDLVKNRLQTVHLTELWRDDYPFRRLMARLKEMDYRGFCLAEIPETKEPVRLMRYYRALWLAYQDLL